MRVRVLMASGVAVHGWVPVVMRMPVVVRIWMAARVVVASTGHVRVVVTVLRVDV